MIRNSLICKLINVQASMKENNEKKINNEHEISKLIKAFLFLTISFYKILETKRRHETLLLETINIKLISTCVFHLLFTNGIACLALFGGLLMTERQASSHRMSL